MRTFGLVDLPGSFADSLSPSGSTTLTTSHSRDVQDLDFIPSCCLNSTCGSRHGSTGGPTLEPGLARTSLLRPDLSSWTAPRRKRAPARQPGLTRLTADPAAQRFHGVRVRRLYRFGQSPTDCLNNIQTLESQGTARRSPSHAMFLPHDPASTGVPGGAPVLGGNDVVQPVELADVLQSRVDELPGAGAILRHFTPRML